MFFDSDVLHIRSVSAMDGTSKESCVPNSIGLRLSEGEVFPPGTARLVMEQAYMLAVKPDRKCITVTGKTAAGVFYGVVSLISLLQGEQLSTCELVDPHVNLHSH